MTAERANVRAFKPRPAVSLKRPSGEALEELLTDMLNLARRLEDNGFTATASMMVGAAYGLTDHPEPCGGECSTRPT